MKSRNCFKSQVFFLQQTSRKHDTRDPEAGSTTLQLQPKSGNLGKGARSQRLISYRSTSLCTCLGSSKAWVSGWSRAPFAPLTPFAVPPVPGHTDHGRAPSGSQRDPKAQDLASHGERSQRHCNLGQMCKALIFLLKKLWPAALNFSSPAFWTPAL